MKSRTPALVLLAGMLLMPLATDIHAGTSKIGSDAKTSKAAQDKPGFTITVEYTGVLDGILEISGVKYRIAQDASIYVSGRGAAPLGTRVEGASLYMTGDKRGSTLVVRNIYVGPGASTARAGKGSIRPKVTPQ